MRPPIRGTLALTAFAVLSWSGATSQAGFASTSGAVTLIDAPPSVTLGALTSDSHAVAFTEHMSFTTAAAINVDTDSPGSVSSYGDLVPTTIRSGTKLDSYFVHSDTVNPNQVYTGSISFTTAILGVIVLDASLDSSDATVGASHTQYATGLSGRGLELNPTADFFNISADEKTISFTLTTGAVMDELRILTAPSVPEPISAVLLGLGGVCSLGLSRARRRRAPRRS